MITPKYNNKFIKKIRFKNIENGKRSLYHKVT